MSLGLLKKVLAFRIKGQQNKIWAQTPEKKHINIYNRVDFILKYCKDKKVVHIGCTDFPFTKAKLENNSLLHQFLQKVTEKITGLDNDKNSIEEYIKLTGAKDVYYGDIMQFYPQVVTGTGYDVILLSEVLEHLINPAKALEVLHEHFSNGTKILVTVPNYVSLSSLAASLNKTESIHPDHYWYFSPYTLCKLFNKEKFQLEQLHFGMYYQRDTKINAVMKNFLFNADCIIAVFSIKK